MKKKIRARRKKNHAKHKALPAMVADESKKAENANHQETRTARAREYAVSILAEVFRPAVNGGKWLLIHSHANRDNINVFSTVILAFGTIAIFIVAIAQWKALEAQDQTTRAQIAAYLSIPDTPVSTIKIAKDGTISGTIYIENTGNSPARGVYVQKYLRWGENTDIPRLDLTGKLVGGPFEIPINAPRPITLDGKLSPALLIFVQSPNSFVIFDGAVAYETIFRDRIVQPLPMIALCCGNGILDHEAEFFHPGLPGWIQLPSAAAQSQNNAN